MANAIDKLPDALLDAFVANALDSEPSLRPAFLSSMGSRVHVAAARASFTSIVIPDSQDEFALPAAQWSPVLLPHNEYGSHVRSLVVRDNDATRPLDASSLLQLLSKCPLLEEFVWESSSPPPDGVCEMISTHNTRLTLFSFHPSTPQSRRSLLPKWDAPSLPLLSTLPLTSLRLSSLSQAGARALMNLFSSLGEYSTLEDVSVDFVWLDDTLCEAIVEANRRLRTLRLGTSGTKLTDRGITALVEGCGALQCFTLQEVQGRLSRGLWSKPDQFPAGLNDFGIVINEASPHHSWTTDHLLSLQALPMESLSKLSVLRLESPPRIHNNQPVYDVPVDDIAVLKHVPPDFVDRMRLATSLSVFECDWWAWGIPDLKVVLENCHELETMKFCLDAPFSKLLTLGSAFASLPNLSKLSVSVNPAFAPGTAPVPVVPLEKSSLPTPTESPNMKAKSLLPQLLDLDQIQTHTCLSNAAAGDPSMPLLRDVKRFARKCPRLALIEWYGKNGRGSWVVSRPSPATSKLSTNVTVEYNAPKISAQVWQALLRQQERERAASKGSLPEVVGRVGQAWTGAAAEMAESAQEKEDTAPAVSRGRQAKARNTSISETPRDENTQLMTPRGSTHSLSPVQTTVPIMSPSGSKASSAITPPVSPRHSNRNAHPARKRAPSEPTARAKAVPVVRERSMTSRGSYDGERNRQYFSKSGPGQAFSSLSSNGANYKISGRGRGGRGMKRQPAHLGESLSPLTGGGRGGAKAAEHPPRPTSRIVNSTPP
ncbi:hypothetical protein PLICRDRAFT_37659 [Plicaturopsis crispa FD-325 SS-3]|nr:hypothetical protein PLICRDRAFT_37659 [Plicaturopsis crispa FD-325 SS-3]